MSICGQCSVLKKMRLIWLINGTSVNVSILLRNVLCPSRQPWGGMEIQWMSEKKSFNFAAACNIVCGNHQAKAVGQKSSFELHEASPHHPQSLLLDHLLLISVCPHILKYIHTYMTKCLEEEQVWNVSLLLSHTPWVSAATEFCFLKLSSRTSFAL